MRPGRGGGARPQVGLAGRTRCSYAVRTGKFMTFVTARPLPPPPIVKNAGA
ncbi:hypothetical protein SSAG_05591 [Streptomyces sp. Mg1]|nr:hypothetical protein SSAG_05591 [Streptomyces sp. Mg1]